MRPDQAALADGDRPADLMRWSDMSWRFRRALHRSRERPRLLDATETRWRNGDRYLRVVWAASAYQDRSQAEHVGAAMGALVGFSSPAVRPLRATETAHSVGLRPDRIADWAAHPHPPASEAVTVREPGRLRRLCRAFYE